MKCRACGFDSKFGETNEYGDLIEFVRINGYFTTTTGTDNYKTSDYRRTVSITIYACPKCATLKVDEGELENNLM